MLQHTPQVREVIQSKFTSAIAGVASLTSTTTYEVFHLDSSYVCYPTDACSYVVYVSQPGQFDHESAAQFFQSSGTVMVRKNQEIRYEDTKLTQ